MNNLIPFGKKDGKLYEPSQVSRGLNCNCVCPECNIKLIACQGNIRKHYFRHCTDLTGYGNCGQTAIHLMAKQIIAEEKRIVVPAPKMENYSVIDSYEEINLEKVILESSDFEEIIPDVVGEYSEKKIFIEIYVSHKVDEQKKEKIRKIGISCLEIDLSDLVDLESISKDELKKAIFEENQRLFWVFSKEYEEKKKELEIIIEKIKKQKAKYIIAEEKRIFVPVPKRKNYSISDSYEEINLEKVIFESNDFEGIAPDIVGEYKNRKIFIEIKISREIDKQKKEKIRESNISCLEIDLSDFTDCESFSNYELKKAIFEDNRRSVWIFNPVYDKNRKN